MINEICYNPSDERDCGDWVELHNPTEFPIDVSNWYFNDSNDENIYHFPNNFRLLPKSYIVLSNDLQSFSTFYPEVTNVIGEFDFGFSGSGEILRFYNFSGNLIDHVQYDDKEPWPEEPDGNGPTLELISPELDNSLPESWQASEYYGTPGRKNSEYAASVDQISLNEDINVSVFPNPVEDILHINIENNSTHQFNIYLINQLGQKMVNHLITNSKNDQLKIDLSIYSAGIYYLIIETLTERISLKVVKR